MESDPNFACSTRCATSPAASPPKSLSMRPRAISLNSSHCNPRATGSAVSIGTVSGPKPAGMGDSDLFLTHSRKLACNAWQHVTDRHVVGGRPDRHRHPRRALGVLAGVAALSLPRGIESPMIPNGCQSCGTGTKYTTLFSACFHTLPEARALSVQYTFFARR